MNFTPFYYQVQELIKNDDDKAVKKIVDNPEQKEEFNSYYEEFIHCTYPDSFKCLYFLMDTMNKRYNVHSLFTHAFTDNNNAWLHLFFDTLHKKVNQFTDSSSNDYQIIVNNVFSMGMDIDYCLLRKSSPEIWDTMFKFNGCGLFEPHMLVNKIFETNNTEQLLLVEQLCNKYSVDLPIINIISKAFSHNKLDIVEQYFSKYHPKFDSHDITHLLNTVALTGNKDMFSYFTQHFLNFNDFNNDKISLAFNSGLIVNKNGILQFLKETHNIEFYPTNENLKSDFIKVRSTMWQDNDENNSFTLELLKNVNRLFDLYQWDKKQLVEEIKHFSELPKLYSKIILHDKLHNKLPNKNYFTPKGKI